MDENTYTVTITPNDFNAFITANGDGTYNVTYTNLQDGQIAAIGQEFANRLSDTDENGNSKTGLHKVALTGNYSQLENKPSASNLQGFHKAAFSGKTSDLNNDEEFLTAATNAYTGSPAEGITPELITSWNNKSNFSGDYKDLINKPEMLIDLRNLSNPDIALLGESGDGYIDYLINHEQDNILELFTNIYEAFIENYKNIYFITDNTRYSLILARKNNYENAINEEDFYYEFILTPFYNSNYLEVLNFTNDIPNIINNLNFNISSEGNILIILDNKISRLYWKKIQPIVNAIDFTEFSSIEATQAENEQLQHLGNSNTYILNYSHFNNNSGISLKNKINFFVETWMSQKTISYFYSLNGVYVVENIKRKYQPDGVTNKLIEISLSSYYTSNMNSIQYSGNNFNNTIAQQQLNDLNIIPKNYFIIIFDCVNDVIYIKKN